jgi:hypothetical protein
MTKQREISPIDESYSALLSGVAQLLAQAKRASARSVNAVMTVTYWEIGRRIVEHEQRGKARAAYGEALIDRLATDLAARFGKGFSQTNLKQMREFFLAWPIRQTLSDESPSAPKNDIPAPPAVMKKYRSEGKGRRNIDPPADGRYTTTVCNIMANEKTRIAKAAGRATNLGTRSLVRHERGQPKLPSDGQIAEGIMSPRIIRR